MAFLHGHVAAPRPVGYGQYEPRGQDVVGVAAATPVLVVRYGGPGGSPDVVHSRPVVVQEASAAVAARRRRSPADARLRQVGQDARAQPARGSQSRPRRDCRLASRTAGIARS